MTTRVPWKSCVFALLLSGCQSVDGFLPWQMSNNDTLTEEELAALHNPQPAAATPELASELQPGDSGGVRTVSATSTSTPVAAGRIEQLVRAGQAAIRDGRQGQPAKLQEASQHFQQVLVEDPENASAHHGLAIVADLQHDWPTAERHYKLALQQRSHDPSLLNDLGYSYILQNRFHVASKYLTRAIQIAPQHELAHINMALLSLKRGDRSGAEARLATIYTPSEINRTLARLEEDLQPSVDANQTSLQQPAVQQPATQQPATQQQAVQQPQMWGPLATPAPQYAAHPAQPPYSNSHQPAAQHQPAYASGQPAMPSQALIQTQPWSSQAPNGMPQMAAQYPTAPHQSGAAIGGNAPTIGQQSAYGQQQQYPQTAAAYGAPGQSQHPSANGAANAAARVTPSAPQKPISVYPEGVQPRTVESGSVATAAVGYPNAHNPINTASQSQLLNHPGTAVGGVIAAPASVQSYPPQSAAASQPYHGSGYGPQNAQPPVSLLPQQSAAGYPAQGPTAQPLLNSTQPQQNQLQAPVQGLNAGPGTLFPITVPGPQHSGNGVPPRTNAPNPQYYGNGGTPHQVNYAMPQNNGSATNVTQATVQQTVSAAPVGTGTVQAPSPAYGGMQRMQNFQQQIQQQHNAPLNQTLQQYAGQRTMPLHQ